MAAAEAYKAIYQLQFKQHFGNSFQLWFEGLARAIYPSGDFQAIRTTQGDGGIDGFVIGSQLVYQVYAPERFNELKDGEMAKKIPEDFNKALATMAGSLNAWHFVHNHPGGSIGKKTASAIARLKVEHPSVTFLVHNIDSFWDLLKELPEEKLGELFPAPTHSTERINIPFRPAGLFEGREADLDEVKKILLKKSRPVVVSAAIEGLGGIGKTELALQLVYEKEMAKEFSTMVWLDGAGSLISEWSNVAKRLGEKFVPADPLELMELIRSKLDQRGRWLVILDNAQDWESVRAYIPDSCSLLVTTRTDFFGGSEFVHKELKVLSDEAASRILLELAPALKHDSALPHLLKFLGGHALAIEIAGHYIKDRYSASEYLDILARNQSDLSGDLHGRSRYNATVEACLGVTWASLRSDVSRLLWRKAALFAPVSAHRELLKVAFSPGQYLDVRAVRRLRGEYGIDSKFYHAYGELRKYHILAREDGYNGERWAMHRLVRDFARSRLDEGEIQGHAFILAEWLKSPTLPVRQEAPHFIAAILDSAREKRFSGVAGLDQSGLVGEAALGRLFFRSHSLFEASSMIEYLKMELDEPAAVALIFDGIHDVDENVRIAAIRLMEKLGQNEEVLKGIVSTLGDPEQRVRKLAVEAVGRNGGSSTIELLSAVLRGPNVLARSSAVEALALMGTPAHPLLGTVVFGQDIKLRTHAAAVLASQGDEVGAAVIVDALAAGALDSGEVDYLLDSLAALMEIVGTRREWLFAIAQHFDSKSPGRRQRVAQILIDTGAALAIDILGGFAASQNREVALSAVSALRELGKLASVRLLEIADGGDMEIRLEAAVILAEQLDFSRADFIVTSIINLLNGSRDRDKRGKIDRCIGSLNGLSRAIRSDSLVAGLRKALGVSDSIREFGVRYEIAILLAKIGEFDAEVKACFLEAISSKIWRIRRGAMKNLVSHSSIEDIDALTELLNHEDPFIRSEAAKAIGRFGHQASRDRLEAIANTEQLTSVREAAIEALAALERTKGVLP